MAIEIIKPGSWLLPPSACYLKTSKFSACVGPAQALLMRGRLCRYLAASTKRQLRSPWSLDLAPALPERSHGSS